MAQGTVGVNILGNTVSIGGSNLSAFGDLIAVPMTPVVQMDFVYGINSQQGTAATANSATVGTSSSRLVLQSGTNIAGAASFSSYRIAKYREGEGMIARFSGAWTVNAGSSTQVIGVGNTQMGYFFGYNGTSFGISIRNGGTDAWVAQSNWNGDKCNGTGASGFNWNQALGNVMQIRYPYLGYGCITFWVLHPITSAWILCHTIQYPNSSLSTQVSNPSFTFYAANINNGNTTNLITYIGCVGIFVTGEREYLGPQWGIDHNKSAITTETCIINLQNCTSFNGVTNQGIIRLRSLTAAAAGGGLPLCVIRFKKGVTIGGSPSYTCINGSTANNGVTITGGNSIASYDTAGTTVSGGTYFFNMDLGTAGSNIIDITSSLIFVQPGEVLTISAFCTASAAISVGINWNEDI
jgi:hypothetical protein